MSPHKKHKEAGDSDMFWQRRRDAEILSAVYRLSLMKEFVYAALPHVEASDKEARIRSLQNELLADQPKQTDDEYAEYADNYLYKAAEEMLRLESARNKWADKSQLAVLKQRMRTLRPAQPRLVSPTAQPHRAATSRSESAAYRKPTQPWTDKLPDKLASWLAVVASGFTLITAIINSPAQASAPPREPPEIVINLDAQKQASLVQEAKVSEHLALLSDLRNQGVIDEAEFRRVETYLLAMQVADAGTKNQIVVSTENQKQVRVRVAKG